MNLKKSAYRKLPLFAMIGAVLLTLAWIVFGLFATSIHNEYGIIGGISGAITNPISGTGVGVYGTFFNIAFVLSGVFIFIGILGVFLILEKKSKYHWLIATLTLLSPIGFIIAGGINLAMSVSLHMVGFFLGGGIPIISCIVIGLYLKKFENCSIFSRILIICFPILLASLILNQAVFNLDTINAGEGIAGITSRITAIEVCFIHFVLGLLGIKQSKGTAK